MQNAKRVPGRQKMLRVFSFLLALILMGQCLQAQHFAVTQYRTVDGLASSDIGSLIMDPDGFIWAVGNLASWARVFDGNQFVLPIENEDGASLGVDGDGFVLVADKGGIWRMTGARKTFHPHPGRERAMQMGEMDDGRLLLFHLDGISVWDGTSFQLFDWPLDSSVCLPIQIAQADPNRFWTLRCSNRFFSMENGHIALMSDLYPELGSDQVSQIHWDGHDLWIIKNVGGERTLMRWHQGQIEAVASPYKLSFGQQEKGGPLWFQVAADDRGSETGPPLFLRTDEKGLIPYKPEIGKAEVNWHQVWILDHSRWFLSPGLVVREKQGATLVIADEALLPAGEKISDIFEDSKGRIWFAWVSSDAADKTLNVTYWKDGLAPVRRFPIEGDLKSSLMESRLKVFWEDRFSRLWVKGNPAYYLEKEGDWQVFDESNLGHAPRPIQPVTDRQGNFWFVTTAGLKRISTHTQIFDQSNGLDAQPLETPVQDGDGNMWVLAGGQLYRQHSQGFIQVSTGLNTVDAILPDAEGGLWLRSRNRVKRFEEGNPNSLEFELPNLEQASFSFVSHMVHAPDCLADRNGRLWFSRGRLLDNVNLRDVNADLLMIRDGKATVFTSQDGLPGGPIRRLVEDRKGTIWVIGSQGLSFYKGESFEAFQLEKSFRKDWQASLDSNGALWLANEGSCRNLTDPSHGPLSLDPEFWSKGLTDMLLMPDGTIAAGERSGVRLQDAGGELVILNWKNGLPGKNITGLTTDKQGRLWIGTERGLAVFEKGSLYDFHRFTNVPRCEVVDLPMCDQRGQIWVPTTEGLLVIDPSMALQKQVLPKVYVTGMETAAAKWTDEPEHPLPFTQRDVTFHFLGHDNTNASALRFQYRLDPYDAQWLESNSQTQVRYTNLMPGRYRFRVRAEDGFGRFTPEGIYAFRLAKPFWLRWWFLTVIAGLLGLLATFAHRLFLRRKLAKQAVANEIRVAREMQMGLMPKTAPQLDGFELTGICQPAREVGGDFFDYMWLDGDNCQLGLVVADVSGKAMKAAMVAVLANGMVATESGKANPPSLILQSVNRGLKMKSPKKMFTTMVAAVLDQKEHALTLANSGHEPPLLLRDGQIVPMKVAGMRLPLGVLHQVNYGEQKYLLEPGDTVVFYSDGVTEALNPKNELFGLERLQAALLNHQGVPAQQLLEGVVREVDLFRQGAEPSDDLTLVILRRQELQGKA